MKDLFLGTEFDGANGAQFDPHRPYALVLCTTERFLEYVATKPARGDCITYAKLPHPPVKNPNAEKEQYWFSVTGPLTNKG